MTTDEYTECLTRHHVITLSSWWRVSTVAAGAEAMEVATGGEATTVAAGASGDATYGIRYNS